MLNAYLPPAIFINESAFQIVMEEKKTCLAMNTRVTNDKGSVSFLCPSCGKYEIVRSKHARQIVSKYTCPECGFVGPN
jgi:predicted RNA-binding Zn-ribbon protein involved in translation (DUF1610 family)